MAAATPVPDTGSARGDIAAQVRQVSAFYASEAGRVFARLLAGVTDPDGAEYFRRYSLAGRRESTAVLWRRAVDRGEARPGIDVDTAADLLFGGLTYRLLNGDTPLTEERPTRSPLRRSAVFWSTVRGSSSSGAPVTQSSVPRTRWRAPLHTGGQRGPGFGYADTARCP